MRLTGIAENIVEPHSPPIFSGKMLANADKNRQHQNS